jgi:hypothetical protein
LWVFRGLLGLVLTLERYDDLGWCSGSESSILIL